MASPVYVWEHDIVPDFDSSGESEIEEDLAFPLSHREEPDYNVMYSPSPASSSSSSTSTAGGSTFLAGYYYSPSYNTPLRCSETGGYDYDFVETPPDKYFCCICSNVLRDARLTECCGQHFCNSCLSRWLDREKTCPHCREDDFKSMVNKALIREINELHIRCTHREKGCDWVGELGRPQKTS